MPCNLKSPLGGVEAEERWLVKTSIIVKDYPHKGARTILDEGTEVPEDLLDRKDLKQYFRKELVEPAPAAEDEKAKGK